MPGLFCLASWQIPSAQQVFGGRIKTKYPRVAEHANMVHFVRALVFTSPCQCNLGLGGLLHSRSKSTLLSILENDIG